MKTSNPLLKLLNIRRDESWLVSQLFFLQFFQGAGIALFFTVANALFLETHQAHQLPRVYIIAACMLWIAGFVYSRLEHALSVRRLIGVVIIFMTASVGLFRVGLAFSLPDWWLYVMAAWYYILYLLANLEFWGLSSMLFDLRQSKRLFGIISAGDIPAKFIGYFSAYLIIPIIGNEDTLYLSMFSMGMSLFFWYSLGRAGHLDIHVDHHHGTAQEHRAVDSSLVKFLQGFFGSRLIFSVTMLSFVVVIAVTIIKFTFYAEVKERIHGPNSNAELGHFIGWFFALGSLIALCIKLLLTGKLADALGVKGSMLITPLILLVAIFAVISSPSFGSQPDIILYVFGGMAVLSETLKAIIQDPVFIAIMQPLRTSLRLRGHTIVKGIMDPFALLFAGLIIVGMIAFGGEGVDLHAICYLLIALIAVWIALIFVVDRTYLTALVDGLNNRYISGKDIDLTKPETKQLLADKIPTAQAGEAIYLLELASRLPDGEKESLIGKGLIHRDEKVRLEAIKIIESKKIQALLPDLQNLISATPSQDILAQSIQAICAIQHDADAESFSVYLDNENHAVVKAAVIGLLKNGSINAVVSAGQKLQQLRDSDSEQERIIAAEVIGALKVTSFYKALLRLLDDPGDKVVMAAIRASGCLGSEKLIASFISKIKYKKYERAVIDALWESGAVALAPISVVVEDAAISHDLRLKLFHLIARIGGRQAQDILESYIGRYGEYRLEIYASLHLCKFKVHDNNRATFEQLVSTEINFASHLLQQVAWLRSSHEDQLIENALLLELDQVKSRLLWLFSFIYDEARIIRAKNGFQINKKESIANAQEIIDLTVRKEVSSIFNIIFEQSPVVEKLALLRLSAGESVKSFDELSSSILSSDQYQYNSWTKAVLMYQMSTGPATYSRQDIAAYQASTQPLLKETSDHALKKITLTI